MEKAKWQEIETFLCLFRKACVIVSLVKRLNKKQNGKRLGMKMRRSDDRRS